ncbi:hypothetical protein [Anaerotignum sp. MB30-C6]|uniref:hypothetical protein n=1 Tax=Anaerotignum sp. MB30-C6 TaxID=3070814 RepID=UPI0027DD2D86|nr:hypothetical protein [Anaerotignum sp. MB30-C6]WMI81571.1 hypothetical protein RBQ60_02210 [Anaerotignum sp. MB30-C6]
MDQKELLQKYYEQEMNNVFAYSTDFRMNSPKKGYENEWCDAKERAELLLEMMSK